MSRSQQRSHRESERSEKIVLWYRIGTALQPNYTFIVFGLKFYLKREQSVLVKQYVHI